MNIKYLSVLFLFGTLVLTGCSDAVVSEPAGSLQKKEALGRIVMQAFSEHQELEAEAIGQAVHLGKAGTYSVLFDQGPSTGELNTCLASWSHTWNIADQFSLDEARTISAIRIFTCKPPRPGRQVHVKILSDEDDIPDEFLYEEFKEPESWEYDPEFDIYEVTTSLTTPFQASAHTKYWTSVSGDYIELGQYSIFSPTDGILAGFRGKTYLGQTSSFGDMCFQLLGEDRPPEIFMTLDTDKLWPANHKMIRVAQGVYATDDYDEPNLTITVSSNEALNAPGDGNTDADWQIIENEDSNRNIYLRAERAGKGDGRVYTITALAVDGSGNETESVATVVVPKSQKKKQK
ncbi:MAG: hypothetical protein K9M49_00150 [Candidatus Marinimicrobia bacterium]|nr:hypothetical protein [Candidatus Neomarinimicrobiota bacterium]MCF7903537.1 hypothetical protein [Candidatus Neomarinimicrobiota bacterium]